MTHERAREAYCFFQSTKWQRAVMAAIIDGRDPYELTYWALGFSSKPKYASHGRSVTTALRSLEKKGWLTVDFTQEDRLKRFTLTDKGKVDWR